MDAAEAAQRLTQARELFEEGDLVGTESTLRLAIDANPFDGRAHYNLGVLALREGRFSTAAARVERAAEVMPRDARPQIGIGSVLLQTGRAGAASEAFKRAMEIDPSNDQAAGGFAIAIARVTDNPEQAVDSGASR